MKLRNKKTGEIIDIYKGQILLHYNQGKKTILFKSIEELEEWEDYEEPKEYWFISTTGKAHRFEGEDETYTPDRKQLGNYFETKEEAEKAIEKLKAWKRLKDKGFRFTLTPGVGSLDVRPGKFQIEINAEMPEKWFCCDAVQKDLEVCFGGEE